MGAHKWHNFMIWIEPLGVTPQVLPVYCSTDYCNNDTAGFIAYFLMCFLLCHDSFSFLSLLASPPHKKANPEENCVALRFSGGDAGKHKRRRNSSFSTYQRRRRATWEFCLTWWSEKLPTEWISFYTEQKICPITRNTTIFVSGCDDDTKSPRPSLWVGVYSHKNSLHTYIAERSCYRWLNKRSASCKTAFITI